MMWVCNLNGVANVYPILLAIGRLINYLERINMQKPLSIFGSTKKIISSSATIVADIVDLGSDQIKVIKNTNKVTDLTEFGNIRTQAIIETHYASKMVDTNLPKNITDFIDKANEDTLKRLMRIELYA